MTRADSGQPNKMGNTYGSGGDQLYCSDCGEHYTYVCACVRDSSH